MYLGKRQKELLDVLKKAQPWYRGCPWRWRKPHVTEEVLMSLMRAGLVRAIKEDDALKYYLTGRGHGMLEPENALREGNVIPIYMKPRTEEDYEGVATLLARISEDATTEKWLVRFKAENNKVIRTIKIPKQEL